MQEHDYVHAQQNLGVLLQNFSSVFEALGKAAVIFDEWIHLNRNGVRDAVLRALPLEVLYSRAILHFQPNHFNLTSIFCFWQLSRKHLPWTWLRRLERRLDLERLATRPRPTVMRARAMEVAATGYSGTHLRVRLLLVLARKPAGPYRK